ncbi:MAG: hypothetical protein STSR0009_17510 [Methanoregula sp.]
MPTIIALFWNALPRYDPGRCCADSIQEVGTLIMQMLLGGKPPVYMMHQKHCPRRGL